MSSERTGEAPVGVDESAATPSAETDDTVEEAPFDSILMLLSSILMLHSELEEAVTKPKTKPPAKQASRTGTNARANGSTASNNGSTATKPHAVKARRTSRRRSPARRAPQVCVCIPTYNEALNVRPFVRAVLREFDHLDVHGVVLIVDDGSPDGTGKLADALASRDPRVHVIHREGKSGIGSAYRAAFAWALEQKCEHVVQMDCDFSHDPAVLGPMLDAAEDADLVLGSRYVKGGETVHWPRARRLVSRMGSLYARLILRVPVRDLTGGFKCFRRETLEQLALEDLSATGYGFQVEPTYRACAPAGA